MSPKFTRLFFMLVVTLFLIIDYFPNIPVLSNIPGVVFFILLVGYLILRAKTKKTTVTQDSLKIQMYMIGYIIVLGGIFMIVAGESQGTIIFLHGVFGVSLFISLLELGRDYTFFSRNKIKTTNKLNQQ